MAEWVTYKKFAERTGIAAKTLSNRRGEGLYPQKMFRKDGTQPMVDIELYYRLLTEDLLEKGGWKKVG